MAYISIWFISTLLDFHFAESSMGWFWDAVVGSREISECIQPSSKRGSAVVLMAASIFRYLSDQLQLFSDRLKKFKYSSVCSTVISWNWLGTSALARLVSRVSENPTNRLHRFFEWVDIPNVRAHWAFLLSTINRHSAVLGYSMNWMLYEPNAQPSGREFERLTTQLFTTGDT